MEKTLATKAQDSGRSFPDQQTASGTAGDRFRSVFQTSPQSVWFGAALVLASGVAMLPLLWIYITATWQLPWMRFAPVSLAVLAVYCYRVPKIGFAASPLRRRIASALAIAGLTVGGLAALLYVPSLAMLAMAMTTTGWLLIWLGIVPWTRIVALSGLLWITWQPPLGIGLRLLGMLENLVFSSVQYVLDVLGIYFYRDGASLDLQHHRLDFSEVMMGWESIYLLLFLTMLWLIFTRRQLLWGLATLVSVPVIAWAGGLLQVLLAVQFSEMGWGDWSSGWSALGLSTAVFIFECLCVLLASYGWGKLLEPLPVTGAGSERGVDMQAVYNRCVLWPLKFALPVGDDGRIQTAEEFGGDETIDLSPRAVPSFRATRAATNPWRDKLVQRILMSSIAIVAVLSWASWLCSQPRENNDNMAVADVGLATWQPALSGMAVPNGLRMEEMQSISVDGQPSQAMAWSLQGDGMSGSLLVTYPLSTVEVYGEREQRAGWQIASPPSSLSREGRSGAVWPIVELELAKRYGVWGYNCYVSMDGRGEPIQATRGLWTRTLQRIGDAPLARLVRPTANGPNIHTLQLFIESSERLSKARKSELNDLLIQAAEAVSGALSGAQQSPS